MLRSRVPIGLERWGRPVSAGLAVLWLSIGVVACRGTAAVPATARPTAEDVAPPTQVVGGAGPQVASGRQPPASWVPQVLAVESFLADIAQQVAGERLKVVSLLPLGVDPHSYEPKPSDARLVAESQLLVVHGAGLEASMGSLLEGALRSKSVIVASAGLEPRRAGDDDQADGDQHQAEGDPHFWLDPLLAKQYVTNIAEGFSAIDPEGAEIYADNAKRYRAELDKVHEEILAMLAPIPQERRLLVTNHEDLGYFAARYGFRLLGSILPGTSSLAAPSARDMAELVERIRATGAPAIFIEAGVDPRLAESIAREAGCQVIDDLYTHSLSSADGPAPTYLDMLRHNARLIARGHLIKIEMP